MNNQFEYGQAEYWEKRYAKDAQEGKTYDWYNYYETIQTVLKERVFKPKFDSQKQNIDFDLFYKENVSQVKVLNLGCGNSVLPEEMYDNDGYKEIWNIDISS